jgi:hypothetical protein
VTECQFKELKFKGDHFQFPMIDKLSQYWKNDEWVSIELELGFSKMEKVMHKFPEEASRSTAAQLLAVFLGSGAYCAINNVFFPGTIPPMDQFMTWITDPTILFALFLKFRISFQPQRSAYLNVWLLLRFLPLLPIEK